MTDEWDPNVIFAEVHEYRIYGDDNGQIYALVDREDYQWCLKWKWSPKWSRGGRKVYLRRVVSNGPRGNRYQTTVFLHQAIMKRKGDKPKNKKHSMIDHKNGNGLDCRRANLRWVTPSMNRKNVIVKSEQYLAALGL